MSAPINWAEIRAHWRAEEERARNLLSRNFIPRCPNCGDHGNLHHTRVEIFYRPVEDGPWHGITVHDGVPVVDCSMPNPSGRRDGLLIFFYCENCDLAAEDRPLAIWQHKGSTYIDWWQGGP
jgi:hypothetical protein